MSKSIDKRDEALKLALKALKSCNAGDYSTGHVIHPSFDEDAVNKAIEAIDALAEQPDYRAVKTWHEGKPVYVAEQPAQQSKLSDYEPDGVHHNKPQKRPQNCGTGYCSCIECLFEQPAQQEPICDDDVCTDCGMEHCECGEKDD